MEVYKIVLEYSLALRVSVDTKTPRVPLDKTVAEKREASSEKQLVTKREREGLERKRIKRERKKNKVCYERSRAVCHKGVAKWDITHYLRFSGFSAGQRSCLVAACHLSRQLGVGYVS